MPGSSRVVVYLAGSIGDDDRWRPFVMQSLEGLNVEFLSPVDRGISYSYKAMKRANEKNRVFLHCDYLKIDRADIVFAFLHSGPSRHSGTSAEIGYSKAKGKTILLVNDMPQTEAFLYEFVHRSADEFFTKLSDGVDYLRDLVAEMQYSPLEEGGIN